MPVTAVIQDAPRVERGYFTHEQMDGLRPVHFRLMLKRQQQRDHAAPEKPAPEPVTQTPAAPEAPTTHKEAKKKAPKKPAAPKSPAKKRPHKKGGAA